MRHAIIAVPLLLALLLGGIVTPAVAQPKQWKEIGQWSIFSNPDGECIAVTNWPDNRYLALGWLPRLNKSVVIFGDGNWRSIEDNRVYNIVLHLVPGPPMAIAAKGNREPQKASDVPRLLVATETRALLDRIARTDVLEVEYRNETIARFELTGSAAAIAGMEECKRLNGKPPPASPPGSPRPSPSISPPLPPSPRPAAPSGPARETPPPLETSPSRR